MGSSYNRYVQRCKIAQLCRVAVSSLKESYVNDIHYCSCGNKHFQVTNTRFWEVPCIPEPIVITRPQPVVAEKPEINRDHLEAVLNMVFTFHRLYGKKRKDIKLIKMRKVDKFISGPDTRIYSDKLVIMGQKGEMGGICPNCRYEFESHEIIPLSRVVTWACRFERGMNIYRYCYNCTLKMIQREDTTSEQKTGD